MMTVSFESPIKQRDVASADGRNCRDYRTAAALRVPVPRLGANDHRIVAVREFAGPLD